MDRVPPAWPRDPEDRGFGVTIAPMRESLAGDPGALMTLLAALGLIVLLIAVDLADLQLVRLEGPPPRVAVRRHSAPPGRV